MNDFITKKTKLEMLCAQYQFPKSRIIGIEK